MCSGRERPLKAVKGTKKKKKRKPAFQVSEEVETKGKKSCSAYLMSELCFSESIERKVKKLGVINSGVPFTIHH